MPWSGEKLAIAELNLEGTQRAVHAARVARDNTLTELRAKVRSVLSDIKGYI